MQNLFSGGGVVQTPADTALKESWEWVFNSLWISSEVANVRGKNCLLNVPLTILFERGEPVRMVGTSQSGFVVRKLFPLHSQRSKSLGRAHMRQEKI